MGRARRQMILKNLSADFPAGARLAAILGGSGSGEVRFQFHNYWRTNPVLMFTLDGLSWCSISSCARIKLEAPATMDLPTLSLSQAPTPPRHGVSPSSTVHETLLYAASLRLPSSTTSQQRSQLVEEVIPELGLKERADTCGE